jgi:hypothetical protein
MRSAGLLWLIAGFVLWSAAFVGLYGLQGIGCAYAWPEPLHRGLLIAGFALTLLTHAGLLAFARRQPVATGTARFVFDIGWLAGIAALVSSALVYAPVLFTSLCI